MGERERDESERAMVHEARRGRGLRRGAVAAIVVAAMFVGVGSVFATSYIWNGSGTITIASPNASSVSGSGPSTWPTAPTVTVQQFGVVTSPVGDGNGSTQTPVGSGQVYCLSVPGPKGAGPCGPTDFSIEIVFTTAATIAHGTDVFEFVTVYTNSVSGTTTAVDPLTMTTTTLLPGTVTFLLEWGTVPVNVESINASVAGS